MLNKKIFYEEFKRALVIILCFILIFSVFSQVFSMKCTVSAQNSENEISLGTITAGNITTDNLCYWIFIKEVDSDYYRIQNKKTGKYLAVIDSKPAQVEEADSDKQLWSFTKLSTSIGQCFNIKNKVNGDLLYVTSEREVKVHTGNLGQWYAKEALFRFSTDTLEYSKDKEPTDGLVARILAMNRTMCIYAENIVGDVKEEVLGKVLTGSIVDTEICYWIFSKEENSDFYRIANKKTGKYLSAVDGKPVQVEISTADTQLWSINQLSTTIGTCYNIKNKANGAFLNVSSDGTISVSSVSVDNWYAKEALFRFSLGASDPAADSVPADGLVARIYAMNRTKCVIAEDISAELDIIAGEIQSGKISTQDKNYWIFEKDENNDYYRFKNKLTGKYLAAIDGNPVQAENSTSETQRWSVTKLSTSIGECYNIKNKADNSFLNVSSDGKVSVRVVNLENWYAMDALFRFSTDTLDYSSDKAPSDKLEARILAQNRTLCVCVAETINNDDIVYGDILAGKSASGSAYDWTMIKDEGTDYYRLVNKKTGKYLAAIGGKAVQVDKNSNDTQLWLIPSLNTSIGKCYNIKNKADGTFLNVSASGNVLLTNVNLDTWAAMDALFRFSSDNDTGFNGEPADGFVTRIFAQNRTMCVYAQNIVQKEEIDHEKYYIESGSSRKHDSILWELKPYKYGDKTVYTIKNKDTGYFVASLPSFGLDSEDPGDESQLFEFIETAPGSKKYIIRSLGLNYRVLVWHQGWGLPYGKMLSNAAPDSTQYVWTLNDGNASVGEGTFTIYSAGGYMRATGNPDYYVFPVDNRSLYVSAEGDDSNDGLSQSTPIRTIARANELIKEMNFCAGNSVLFRKGDTFVGELRLLDIYGTEENPVTIGTYGNGDKRPKIIAPESKGTTSAENRAMVEQIAAAAGKTPLEYEGPFERPENATIYSAISITGGQHIIFEDIDCYSSNDGEKYFTLQGQGNALIEVTSAVSVTVRNVSVKAEVKTRIKEYNTDMQGIVMITHGKLQYPYQGNAYAGVIVTQCTEPTNEDYSNIVIDNLEGSGLDTVITVTSSSQFTVKNSYAHDTPLWAFNFGSSSQGKIINCTAENTGYGENNNGNAAFMCTSCQDLEFDGIKCIDIKRGPNEADGVGFDFEGGVNQRNITLKNSIFNGIEGSAIMLFFNTDGNKDIIIDNCFIQRANLLETGEGAINMCSSPVNYKNTATIINVTIVQYEGQPFYTGYYDLNQEMVNYKGVNFINCNFITKLADKTPLKELLKKAEKIKQGSVSDYEWQMLQSAIDSAKILLNNEYATESMLNDIIKILETAMKPFKNQEEDITENIADSDNALSNQEEDIIENIVDSDNDISNQKTDLEKFKERVEEAVKNGDANVIIQDTELPILTSEMLQLVKDAQKGLILQKNDSDGNMLLRFTIKEIVSTENSLDLTLLDETVNKLLINEALGDKKHQLVAFASTASLPGKTQIIIRNEVGFEAGKLYQVAVWNSEKNGLDEYTEAMLTNDGAYIAFNIDSCGEFVIYEGAEKALDKNGKKDTNVNISAKLWVIGIAAAVLVIGGITITLIIVVKKKKTEV